ncbi:NAD-dependent dehydratase [Streptomyces alboflavus]|uniref:NAD-dependent dehydratase n=1 Tax=Streptomyces alboflavus TaxID=67267 RepID=A0A1Z1W636_9ACTN|nr:NAD-dependent dehydratase [Streptomyces alboflavus]
MRVLVTGGAGFIGTHVVDALLARGHEVVSYDAVLASAHGGPPRAARAGERLVVGDVRDPDGVESALAGVDAVCHQAAMVGLGKDFADAPAYVGCNDLGTAVLLAAMARAGLRDLVLAGSMVVYGEGRYVCARHGVVRPGPRAEKDLAAGRFEPLCPSCGAELAPGLVAEDAPLDPRNVYATTKLAQEHLSAAWARSTDGRAVSLRYHNVYGPGMPRDTPMPGWPPCSAPRSPAVRRRASSRTAASGGTSCTYGTWRRPRRWPWSPCGTWRPPGRSRPTTRAAATRTPSARWPAPSPMPTADPRPWSPGSTGSATSAM